MSSKPLNKKYFSSTIRSITFTIFFLVVSMPLFSQEITEKNYLKLDSALWIQYEQDMEKISKDFTNYPEKKDSLQKVSEYIFEVTSKKNRELAIQYASVPSGLQRIFMTRLRIPKNTLDSVLKSLPDEIKNSQYAKNIQYHIESKQLEEGDKYQDMVLKTDEGKDFKLSSLQGKDILFIYGGLDCMGVAGRKYLNTLYSKTSRDNFEIVMYCLNTDLNHLSKVRETYPCDFILVSDFLQDGSPVKIVYGTQATPTCFIVDKGGIIKMKTVGLHVDKINELGIGN